MNNEVQLSFDTLDGPINKSELPGFDWAEISLHNSKQDCWVVIDNHIYDVTNWVDRHPGGQVLCSMAGEDVSAMFHSSHFRDVKGVMRQYLVGQLRENHAAQKYNSKFHVELKKRVHAFFSDNQIEYRSTRKMWIQFVPGFLAFAACWYAAWALQFFPALIPMGLISCAMVGGFAHEYSHNSLIKSGNKNNNSSKLMSSLWAVFCPFMFEKQFQYEHLKHHMAPMDSHIDYEIRALRNFVRLSRDMPWKPYFRFQHFYAPLVYMFYITIQVIGGAFFYQYFSKRQLRIDPEYFFQMYPATAITLVVHVFIPIFLVGWWFWLIGFLVYNAVWQISTYLVAAVPHMVESENIDSTDWSYRSCFHTRNVLCGNWFYDWLSGGFNYQIDHHLLPSISREHLPKINTIVRRTCAEYQYPYFEYTNLRDYLGDHYRYLKKLGVKPSNQTEG